MVSKVKLFVAIACVVLSASAVAGLLAPIRGSTGYDSVPAAAIWWAALGGAILSVAGSIPLLKELWQSKRKKDAERLAVWAQVREQMAYGAEVYSARFAQRFQSYRHPLEVKVGLHPQSGCFTVSFRHPTEDYPAHPLMKDKVAKDLTDIFNEQELKYAPMATPFWKYRQGWVTIKFQSIL